MRVVTYLSDDLVARLDDRAGLARRTRSAMAAIILEAGLGEGGSAAVDNFGGQGRREDPPIERLPVSQAGMPERETSPSAEPPSPSPDDRPLWQKRLDANKKP
jgi:hypothetical protein